MKLIPLLNSGADIYYMETSIRTESGSPTDSGENMGTGSMCGECRRDYERSLSEEVIGKNIHEKLETVGESDSP